MNVLEIALQNQELEEEIRDSFEQNYGFLMVSKKRDVYICLKNHTGEVDDLWVKKAMELSKKYSSQSSTPIEFKILPLKQIKGDILYAQKFLPTTHLANARCLQGLRWSIDFAQNAVFASGSEKLYLKVNHEAEKTILRWQEHLDLKLGLEHSKDLIEKIEYQPLTRNVRELAQKFHERIKEKEDEILQLLTTLEPHNVAEDEIMGSLDTLKNIDKQLSDLKRIEGYVGSVSVFLPMNLPLYSFVLFALVIGLVTEKVYIRCPLLCRGVLQKLMHLLEIDSLLPGIQLLNVERGVFRDHYVAHCDVIIFTGKYDNANLLLNEFSDKLFIFNGYGVNPIVIAADADLNIAAKKVVQMRTYNSGQDCTAPDAILVHESVEDEFAKKLQKELNQLKIGDYQEKETRIGKIHSQEAIMKNIDYLREKKVIYGGLLDYVRGIMHPTIISSPIGTPNVYEFFAPIFNLLKYSEEKELKKYFTHKSYRANNMYVSVFGQEPYLHTLEKTVLLENKIVLDVDCGYEAFGGYGRRANFINHKEGKSSFPILISRDVAFYLGRPEQENENNPLNSPALEITFDTLRKKDVEIRIEK